MTRLKNAFQKIDARLKVTELDITGSDFRIDVREDSRGEFFALSVGGELHLEVVNARPGDRHLLLHVEDDSGPQKFLCGFDERHLFVASVDRSAATVEQAKESLKPDRVAIEQDRKRVRPKNRNKRHNRGFTRQGEWFFLPRPDEKVDSNLILRNEPLQRDWRSKAHIVEEVVRDGGTTVYVSRLRPTGVTEEEYRRLISHRPSARNVRWQIRRRNPRVMARGRVRHADHKTLRLRCWHEVIMNREAISQNNVFLD